MKYSALFLVFVLGCVHQLPNLGSHVYSVSGAIDLKLNSTPDVYVGTFQ